MTVTTSSDNKLDFSTFANIIDGQRINTPSTRSGINPATDAKLFPCPVSTRDDVENAITAAKSAFKIWKRTTVDHRKGQLRALAAALIEHKAGFARLLTTEGEAGMLSHFLHFSFLFFSFLMEQYTDSVADHVRRTRSGLRGPLAGRDMRA